MMDLLGVSRAGKAGKSEKVKGKREVSGFYFGL
jgi:hypothetical protein